MTVTPEFLTGLLARWGVAPDAVWPTERGTNNRTFAVVQGGRRWALRISENLSAAQVRAEHRLLGRLRRAGLPFAVPEPVPSLDGDTLAETPAGSATLCHWLPGARLDLAGEPAMERFGRAMGLLGEALRDVPPDDAPHDWRGSWRVHPDVPDRDDLCRELRAAGVSPDQVTLLETAATRVEAWRSRVGGGLPVQVVHGDLGSSNLLADERTITAVLDFEIAGADFRVQDLVAALLNSGALDGPAWPRRTAALTRGHASARRLNSAETQAVRDLLLMRAVGSVLWRAGRWRRQQAQLGDVTDRLRKLDATSRWLATSSDQLLPLLSQP